MIGFIKWFTNSAILDELSKFLKIIPIDVVDEFGCHNRHEFNHLPHQNKKYYCDQIVKVLTKHQIKTLILTFDWIESMRLIVVVAKNMGIETVLVPHESVMQNVSRYYKDMKTKNNKPSCKHILIWGDLQKRIFLSRGIKEQNMQIMGTPKFDCYFTEKFNKSEFLKKYDFPEQPTIVMCCQYFDTQYTNQKNALNRQMECSRFISRWANNNGYNFIARIPTGGIDIPLEASTVDGIVDNNITIYKSSIVETIQCCDFLVSFNSTTILEASIANKPTAIMGWFKFWPMWTVEYGVPMVDQSGFGSLVKKTLNHGRTMKNFNKAEIDFSYGKFDGKSASKIAEFILSL